MPCDVEIGELLSLATKAGESVMEVYRRKFKFDIKYDKSPITDADIRSNKIIVDGLKKLYPEIPIISEESKNTRYPDRRNWKYFWLIDPLDGTKEFIKKNGEFTINIALVHNNDPITGLIYLPDKQITYYAKRNKGSYRIDKNGGHHRIHAKRQPDANKIVIAGSRSHASEELHTFVAEKKKEFKNVELVSRGSSIKFCLVAEGLADLYLRTGPTMEWDTAAGHIIVNESGKQVYIYNTNNILTYNKRILQNPWFLVR